MHIEVDLPRPYEAKVNVSNAKANEDAEIKITPRFYQSNARSPVMYLTVKDSANKEAVRYQLIVSGTTGRLTLVTCDEVECTFDAKRLGKNVTEAEELEA